MWVILVHLHPKENPKFSALLTWPWTKFHFLHFSLGSERREERWVRPSFHLSFWFDWKWPSNFSHIYFPFQGAKQGKKGGAKGGGGKGGGKEDLKTCNQVKVRPFFSFPSFSYRRFNQGRHILCEKQGKILEVQAALKEGWLDAGDNVPAAEFGKVSSNVYL